MKYLSLTLGILLITCFSCQQEEEIMPENSIVEEASAVSISKKKKCPPPTITLTRCGYGFRFNITRGGIVDTGTYYYIIKNNATGVTEDAGFITDNNNTNWVLSACTLYDITVYDWCVGAVTQTKVSDGCGGLFLC
ncbi:MAG: hypothetical protein AAFQ94_01555 [Bacteroidota bacterium]